MKPITLYAWPTPNAHKVSIYLEEAEIPYTVVPVNIGSGDQFKADFLALNPNNKMPVIVDPEGPEGAFTVIESGAILLYLAEKTGRFWPKSLRERSLATQWVMFQMGGIGPMFGQLGHFKNYAKEKLPYAIERYENEVKRLLHVLDKRLEGERFLAGEYGIADMASFPWVRNVAYYKLSLDEYPHVARWVKEIEARPAVQRGLALLKENARKPGQEMSDAEREVLFGKTQHQRR